MIKLRFVPYNESSKNLLVTIGKKYFLDLSLKPTKSWKSVQEHLCKKWNDIPDLVHRLTLHPCLQETTTAASSTSSSTLLPNLLTHLQQSVITTLQEYPHYSIKPSEEGQIIPIFYLIHSSSISPSFSPPAITVATSSSNVPTVQQQQQQPNSLSEDSLLQAINNWNDNSIDCYLQKEKSFKFQSPGQKNPLAVAHLINARSLPTGEGSLSKLETLSTVAASAALIESTISNYSGYDPIMNSSTLHGLIQDLMQENSTATEKTSPLKQPDVEASKVQPLDESKESGTVNQPTPSLSKQKKNLKSAEKKVRSSNSKPKLTQAEEVHNTLPKSEFTNLLQSFALEATQLHPSTSSTTPSFPSADSHPFINHENSLYIRDVYGDGDYDECSYSKSNTSHSNRNFAHIFSMSEQSKQVNPDEKAMNLLNSLVTSNSLYQAIMSQGGNGNSNLSIPKIINKDKKATDENLTKNEILRVATGAVFGAASPSTVVTPISDTETSNLHPPLASVEIANLCSSILTPTKHTSCTNVEPPTSAINWESFNSPAAPDLNNGISKTPLSSKKRKFNGLQQKRQELLNGTHSDIVENVSHSVNFAQQPSSSSSEIYSPMKVPRTSGAAATPSKGLLIKENATKAQVSIEQHVLSANIISGVCHIPPGYTPPTSSKPSFIQHLSRVGRSRPDLRRITPTFIGPLPSMGTSSTSMTIKY